MLITFHFTYDFVFSKYQNFQADKVPLVLNKVPFGSAAFLR